MENRNHGIGLSGRLRDDGQRGVEGGRTADRDGRQRSAPTDDQRRGQQREDLAHDVA